MRSNVLAYARLAIFAAIITIVLKLSAFWITGSVGLLADGLESLVNLVGAVLAWVGLRISLQPPDEKHPYGHEKVEYFASGAESGLILIAGLAMAWKAGQRLLAPEPITDIDLGILLSLLAAALNWAVARVLARGARTHRSVTLKTESRHLMTDVWTSVAVVIAIGLIRVTGQPLFDPLVALLLAAHILQTGVRLLYGSLQGLMDRALPARDLRQIKAILAKRLPPEAEYHALRSRRAGARRFVSFHVQVPGEWSVQKGHDLLEEIEAEVRLAIEGVTVLTHLEPVEDPASWEDQHLDRS